MMFFFNAWKYFLLICKIYEYLICQVFILFFPPYKQGWQIISYRSGSLLHTSIFIYKEQAKDSPNLIQI